MLSMRKWFLTVLTTMMAVSVSLSGAFAQGLGKTVKGVVLDSYGEPVIGASVMIKGTRTGTITSLDGHFSLDVLQGQTLEVSSVGFVSKTVFVSDQSDYSIILEEDRNVLDEVVVVGYGTKIKKDIVGAVDQVGSEALINRASTNAMQALQGASPNLVIQVTNSNPTNSTMNVNIRGVSTLNNNDPLVVIDGVTTDVACLNRINPDDIESVSVLKDAGSAAIYGSRSSSGVILVTTKTGRKSDRPIVKFSAMAGQEIPVFLFEPVSGYENAILRNQALANVGKAPEFTPDQIRDIYEHKDQQYLLFQIMQPAWKQNYSASISGGGDHSTYMISLGYQDQNSNFIGDKYDSKRYNVRSNLSSTYGRLKIISQMSFNRVQNYAPNSTNAIQNATRWPTYYYYTMVDDLGRYVTERTSQGILEAGGHREIIENNFIGNLTAELSITQGLKARVVLAADLQNYHRFIRAKEFFYYSSSSATEPGGSVNNTRETSDYNRNSYLVSPQFILDYNQVFGDRHNVSALLGVSNESYTEDSNQVVMIYTDPDLGTPAADGLTEYDTTSYTSPSGLIKTSISSVFGRVGYSLDDKYYSEVSFRYDGSSKFMKKNRWGFFPSLSLGWRISQENFMQGYKSRVGDLKIRGSYGILGNQNVGNYKYLTTYTVNTDVYGFGKAPVSGTNFSFGNEELTWEKTASLNVGIDATFFKNALTLSFDWFNQKTYDILIAPEVPAIFGGSVATENTGKMRNRGWEFTANYRFRTGEVQHSLNFNLADSRNEVIDFPEVRINDAQQMSTIIKEGLPLNSYYGWKVAGYFRDEVDILESALPAGASVQPGDVKYEDYCKDGVIDEKDRQVLGNAFPRYTFGLKYDVAWKGFDFGFLIQGVGKRDMILRGEMIIPFASDFTTTMFRHQTDTWTPVNIDARWPRLAATGSASNLNNYWNTSDIFLLNAAYLRLKNIQIGYTLPERISRKAGMSKLRFFVNAENLLTWSATGFWDPENTEFGNSMGGLKGATANSGRSYPFLKYIGFGVNVEF